MGGGILALLLVAALGAAHAFVLPSMTAHQRCATSLQAVTTRRALLSQAVAFGAALAVPALALAEGYEDLSADDAPEPVRETLTDEERIKRKLEAQAKATGKGSSGRQSYQERTANEIAKQKAASRKSAKQRQEDLCEQLGRGC
eukprot:TRINITY_DN2529_c0_g1_i1.p2 TRINITY_DN2529_c0_g1~~TRINITY_DN2529_c0_g1_i1.p2  ORF type:complete len:144 (-),score=33.36 TRINITY_DN2529_c0_g1_i1:379-810(-)